MTKTLVLVRHAHALSALDAHVQSDALRPLSPQGRQKAAETAARLKSMDLHPTRILTSPLLRAKQTADILSQALQCPAQTAVQLDGLYSEQTVKAFLLQQLQTDTTLVVVGHNPNITYVNHLFCGQVHSFLPGSFSVLNLASDALARLVTFGE